MTGFGKNCYNPQPATRNSQPATRNYIVFYQILLHLSETITHKPDKTKIYTHEND